jgi:hypothetical protein
MFEKLWICRTMWTAHFWDVGYYFYAVSVRSICCGNGTFWFGVGYIVNNRDVTCFGADFGIGRLVWKLKGHWFLNIPRFWHLANIEIKLPFFQMLFWSWMAIQIWIFFLLVCWPKLITKLLECLIKLAILYYLACRLLRLPSEDMLIYSSQKWRANLGNLSQISRLMKGWIFLNPSVPENPTDNRRR